MTNVILLNLGFFSLPGSGNTGDTLASYHHYGGAVHTVYLFHVKWELQNCVLERHVYTGKYYSDHYSVPRKTGVGNSGRNPGSL